MCCARGHYLLCASPRYLQNARQIVLYRRNSRRSRIIIYFNRVVHLAGHLSASFTLFHLAVLPSPSPFVSLIGGRDWVRGVFASINRERAANWHSDQGIAFLKAVHVSGGIWSAKNYCFLGFFYPSLYCLVGEVRESPSRRLRFQKVL